MRLLLFILGLLVPASLSAAAGVAAAINRQVATCAAAWQREDFPAIIAHMPPHVVQRLGGRAALERELKQHFAAARELGAERLEVRAGEPSALQLRGRWTIAYVPLTAVVHSAYVDLTQDTGALAVSPDRGRRWFFVLLYGTDQAELDAWFPEFRGQVRVPVAAKPRLTLAN
ncbi:hypothetical protein [Opitutus terrae]|nr:hypothetical protein [Opitutus terrae]